MANISDEDRRERLLEFLPANGDSIGNRALAARLNWDSDLYFKIRDQLLLKELVQVGRGRGGSTRLAEPKIDSRPKLPTADGLNGKIQKERRLYPKFRKSLDIWVKAQGWRETIIQQTSDQGSRKTGGKFTRPDFVLIGYRKYEFTPGVVRDIETFELKAKGAQIDSVFEAAAHSRAATKSYLVLEVDESTPTEDELARFEAECQRFSIGLITFTDAGKFDTWKYLVDPVRVEPDPELLEQFVRDQIDIENQRKLRMWIT